MLGILSFSLVAASLVAAVPANDWSKPCFDGECAWELPHKDFSGVMRLRGSPKAITDITPAAGWVILDCDPNTLEQEIRLVCQGHDEAGCQHMFDYHGPEDKLVRLPESCGHGPFARIASARVAEDQDIPAHVEGKISRRDGVAPLVHHVKIDTNFAAVDVEKTGRVEIAYQAINVPNIDANFQFTDFFWDDAINWIKGAATTVSNTVTTAANSVAKFVGDAVHTVTKSATEGWKKVTKFVETIPDTLKKITTFNIDTEILPEKTFELHGDNTTLIHIPKESNCPANIGGSIDVVMDGDVFAKVTVGLIMVGSVIPPKIDNFNTFIDINADIDTKLKVEALLHGTFQSKRFHLLEIGIPMFSIPKIFEVGPWLQLDAQAKAHLGLAVALDLNVKYKVEHMRIWWPDKQDTSQRSLATEDSKSPLTLKTDAALSADAIIEGHLIPSVKLGIKLGEAEASLFVEADAYARLSLHADAQVHGKVGRDLDAGNKALYSPPYGHRSRSLGKRGEDNGVQASFTGCVWLAAGVTIYGGVKGTLGSLKAAARMAFWKSDLIPIYDHCWSAGVLATSAPPAAPQFTFPESEDAVDQHQCPTKVPTLNPSFNAGSPKGKKLEKKKKP